VARPCGQDDVGHALHGKELEVGGFLREVDVLGGLGVAEDGRGAADGLAVVGVGPAPPRAELRMCCC
jgi:hypothetical protein